MGVVELVNAPGGIATPPIILVPRKPGIFAATNFAFFSVTPMGVRDPLDPVLASTSGQLLGLNRCLGTSVISHRRATNGIHQEVTRFNVDYLISHFKLLCQVGWLLAPV